MARPADAESGWLRVTSPYSGDGKGHLFTPEVGSQVLVSYEHGRPEFPMVSVLGCRNCLLCLQLSRPIILTRRPQYNRASQ